MSLIKNARKIIVNEKIYKWKIGALYRDDGFIYCKIYIDLPSGKTESFEECMGTTDIGVQYPVTPETVRNLIESNNL